MRNYITIAKLRGSPEFEFVFGPDTSTETQREWLKEQRQSKVHARYDEVQLWVSDEGRVIVHRFQPPAVAVSAPEEIPTAPPAELPAILETHLEEPPAEAVTAHEEGDAAADFDVQPATRRGRSRR